MSLNHVWKQDVVGAFPFLSPRASSSVLILCSRNMLPLCLSSVLIYMRSTFFTVLRPCQNSNSSNNNNTTGSWEVSRVFCVLCLSMELWALCVIPSTSLWAVVPLHRQGSQSAARLMARTGRSVWGRPLTTGSCGSCAWGMTGKMSEKSQSTGLLWKCVLTL